MSRTVVNEALGDDFDTPSAFAMIFEFIRSQNTKGVSGKYVYEFFKEINQFLDIFDFEKEEIPEEIKKLAEERLRAREAKNWAESDRLRDLIKEKGYVVEDLKNDCKIRKSMLS